MGLTGHVEEIKKNQHYRLVVNLEKDESGPKTKYPKKRKDVRCGGKREAESLLKEWIDELEQAAGKKYSDMLLKDYMFYWVSTVAKPNLEDSTYDSYLWEIEKHISPGAGHIPLCELLPIHVQTLISYWLESGRLKKHDLEADIIQVVSKIKKATVKDVYDVLSKDRKIAYNTVVAALAKLAQKKLLDRQKNGRTNLYFPMTIKEKDATENMDKEKRDKPKGLSNRSVEYKYTILNQALEYAVKPLKLIAENPCNDIKVPKSKETQKEKMVVLTKGELKDFLNRITGHRDYPLIYTAAYTGMRISELLGLRWQDILTNEKKLSIQMTMHISKDKKTNAIKYEHRPRLKNKKPRVIDVTDSVLDVLHEHKKQLMADGKLNNKYKLVFPGPDGMPEDRRNPYHRFVNIASKMGHKGMRFHDLRHTHATILLSAGEMLNAVSERLGHKDVQTTSRIYAHVLPQKAVDTANKFEELMNS